MELSEYSPLFRICILALILLDNYAKFAVISCLSTPRVISCHCVLISCEAAQWRETFPKHKNVPLKSYSAALSPQDPTSISQSPTIEVDSWCPFICFPFAVTGLDDLKGLSHPKQFHDSVIFTFLTVYNNTILISPVTATLKGSKDLSLLFSVAPLKHLFLFLSYFVES